MNEKNLGKDELIGLHVKILDCTDPGWKGRSGLIIDETKNTFTIKVADQPKMIAKNTATFEFNINGKRIILDGSKIKYRPEDRIKKVR